MKVATQKITSLFFTLLGFAPLLLSVVFVIKQQSIRHTMKERMEEQMMHTVTLPRAEIIWLKDGKEILVSGVMFDVKSIEYKNGMAIFHGLYDDEETLLNKNFSKGWEKNQSEQNQLLAQLFQCLQTVYFDTSAATPVLINKQPPVFFASTDTLLNQFKTILTPPPQV